MVEAIDSALKARLRAVLDGTSVTEAELRKLFEEGQACVLILGGQLERTEKMLAALSLDPASSVAQLAASIRRVNELRSDLDELNALLGALTARAREFRASWISRGR